MGNVKEMYTGFDALKNAKKGLYQLNLGLLADELGITPGAITYWRSSKIPAEYVPKITKLTEIPRHVLRPDLWEAPE